jgi:hypothetical protein
LNIFRTGNLKKILTLELDNNNFRYLGLGSNSSFEILSRLKNLTLIFIILIQVV